MMDWIESANKEQDILSEVHSFQEYMDLLEKRPLLELRHTSQYLIDVIDYFGKDFALFKKDLQDSPRIFGQQEAQRQIYQNLKNFCEEGFNNKLLLLVGPNGSSKTSLIKKIMKGAEIYSETDEGSLYSFSWVFPIENFVKGSLGFHSGAPSGQVTTFAHLDDKEISSILTSELHDHPLLLIPIKARQKIINDLLTKEKCDEKRREQVKRSYLYEGDLSKRNRMIYDALLKSYKGHHLDVLKHIRVERFTINRRYSTAAVTIEPQLHVDARMQQITMDRRLSKLPPSLQSLNLFTMQGEMVMANRGILEFSDLLKRPLDTFKYLLMTTETRNINIQGILTDLDLFLIGSSNELHLSAFKQHPDYHSFKGRINFIKVPYLLNYREEAEIYREQITHIKNFSYFEPLAIEILSLFAVMTRIRPCTDKSFSDRKLGVLSANLNPLEKTLLLADNKLPDRYSSEEKQTLKMGISEIMNEYIHDNLYEGKFGISPRSMKQIIYEISSEYDNVTFIEVIEYLIRFIERKNEFDFLNLSPQGDFGNHHRTLEYLQDHALDIFDLEFRESLGMVDDRSYEDYIFRYIANVKAMIKNEKIKNPVTGQFEEYDKYFIQEFEKNINLKESADNFRSHMISSLGAYSLDYPDQPLVYTKVFPETVELLRSSFRDEQKKLILKIGHNLELFIKEWEDSQGEHKSKMVSLNEEMRSRILLVLENLQKKFHYSERGALKLLQLIIKERY